MSKKSCFHDLGVRYVKLGVLLKNPRSMISEIVEAASDIGLEFQFRLAGKEEAIGELIERTED